MKSHVTMEQHACIVCGQPCDTGALLIDKKLRERFDMHTVTGMGICDEHAKMRDEGFIALVEVDPAKSRDPAPGAFVKAEDAYRTGAFCHLKREAFECVINVAPPEKGVCFVEPGVIDRLRAMVKPDDREQSGA